MKSLVGTTLGQYRIVEQIGTGGMATVFKAYQPALDRYVAIKVLPAQHALTPGFSERFTREAKAVAQLNHPNILPIYDFGQEGDLSYIVMKYVPAGTLKDRLGQPMTLQETIRFIEQMAGALDHAHGRGILHRDVKPSNVLLDEGDWVLLTDFGLARMIAGETCLTATGVGMGTPAYMSPEQGKGEKVDQRTDIYSLGVILYEMVTGRVPYEAETPLAVVLKHVQGDLPLPRSINPAIPEAVERVILKAMAKEPENRYGSTGEMAEALKRVLEAPAVPAVSMAPPPKPEAVPAIEPPKPATIVEEAKRPFPWLPLVVGGGVVLLLVVAAVLLAALLVPRLLRPRATPMPTKVALPTEPAATPLLPTLPLAQGIMGWEQWLQGGSYYAGHNEVRMVDDPAYRRVVEFLRTCEQPDGGAAGIYQAFNLDVSGYSYLYVRLVGKVLQEEGGNLANSNPLFFPEGAVQVRVKYLTANGEEREWYHGFYAQPVVGADSEHFTRVEREEWFTYTSPDLMALPEPPQRIIEFRVYGFGWQFRGQVAEVDLIGFPGGQPLGRLTF